MERKVYLIFSDCAGAVRDIKGYIWGTEEEAQAYCEDLNRAYAKQKKVFAWSNLPRLFVCESHETLIVSETTAASEKLMEKKGKAEYMSATKAAEDWGVSPSLVCRSAREGCIPGAEFIGNRWRIPVDAEKVTDKKTFRKSGFISLTKAAEK